MNRTIKDATVKRFYYESHDQLRQHLADFVAPTISLAVLGSGPIKRFEAVGFCDSRLSVGGADGSRSLLADG